MRYNIIEVDQMIDYIDDFFNRADAKVLNVGGSCGTSIFRHVIDSATNRSAFCNILVLDGCQDLVGLNKKVDNYKWYADILNSIIVDPIVEPDPTSSIWSRVPTEYRNIFNTEMSKPYNTIIIVNAHLIEREILQLIDNSFHGKVVNIVDPFDIGGEYYTDVYTITDSFMSLPMNVAMARDLYDIDTRIINTKAKSKIEEIKISIRSIGKIDDKQYISNDPELINIIQQKQYNASLRKNQKVMINDKRLYKTPDGSNSIYKTTMMVVESVSNANYIHQLLRIYGTRVSFGANIYYQPNDHNNNWIVKPANIISMEEQAHHRYKNAVLITSSPLTIRENYSVLKNSNNLSISFKKV